MNISVKGEYALQAIFDLAANSRSQPVKIADIARRQQIPQKFLELILASLKQGGFVESGGAPKAVICSHGVPSQLHGGEVLRFIEGRREEQSRLRRGADSVFTDLWQRVDLAIDSVLAATTFAQLVRESQEKHNRFVPNWEI